MAVLTQTADDMRRLHKVGGTISFRAAYLCGENVRPQLGLAVWNQYSFDDIGAKNRSFWDDATPWRDAAIYVLGVSEALQIGSVVPDSPAAQAGLMPGDTVLSVDGKKAPTGENAVKELLDDLKETVTETDQIVSFEIGRGGQRMTAAVRPQDACDFPITLHQSPIVNALADGTNVVGAIDDEAPAAGGGELGPAGAVPVQKSGCGIEDVAAVSAGRGDPDVIGRDGGDVTDTDVLLGWRRGHQAPTAAIKVHDDRLDRAGPLRTPGSPCPRCRRGPAL